MCAGVNMEHKPIHLVTKSNKLVEANYRLSVSEQRVIAVMASKVAPTDEDFMPYEFKVSDLAELLETGSKNLHERVRDTTKGLVGRVIQIREPKKLIQVAWLSSATYHEGKGTVELCFDPSLRPYLLQLKERFTTYQLKNVVSLRSCHSVRIYELLKQYAAMKTRTFKPADLRAALGLEKDSYKTWKDFRLRVLNHASRELKTKTDISFTYTVKKGAHGRVEEVTFTIREGRSGLSKTDLTRIRAEASACWNRSHGSCAAKWSDHDEPHDTCHWCKRFDTKRAEAAGQSRLPGLE
jgi:plasmid replication initiation protein